MRKIQGVIVLLGVFAVASGFADGVIHPRGLVAAQERKLLFDTIAIMLIVVLPVILMSFAFAHRFRESGRTGEYRPEWSHNTLLESFWWGIPALIILILSIILWNKTHELDPYQNIKGVDSSDKQIIQVVALSWKWLFIYPKEGIATINDLVLPAGKQVEFHITADAPMSAFAIPQLVGQIYAMAGMRTRLHLYSDHVGTYDGLNTQLNGEGFSDMHFPAHVVEQTEFDQWVAHMKYVDNPLSLAGYATLYQPTIAAPAMYFSQVPERFFMQIIEQYTHDNAWLHAV